MCGHRLEPRQEAGPSASAYPTEVCRVALSLQCLHCQGQCWQLSAAPLLECVNAVSAPIIVCAAVVTRCRLARRCKLADQAVTARARAGALSVQWRGCADRRRGARQVLPGFLFLGSYDNASRTEVLKTLGITHVLNVRADAPQPPQPAHAVPPSLASPAGPARRQHANVRPQTVPACQELYRNSFAYHTVRTSPPDYQECFDFLGARAGPLPSSHRGCFAHAVHGGPTSSYLAPEQGMRLQ